MIRDILQAHNADEPQDDYKGGTGWVIVVVGLGGNALVADYDGDFGAFRYMLDSCMSNSTAEDLGVEDCPEDPGVYKGQFETWTTSIHDYDGADNDMGFSLVGEWETIWEPE